MARDIILNLAISLDGFICDEDGGFAWISGQGEVRADTADHFDFDGFLASCDTIVMGRKAYEDCLSSLPEAAEKRFLVASRTPRAPEGRVVFLSADVVAEAIDAVNRDPAVHGCLLLRPLPPHLRGEESDLCARLAPDKDVDGMTPESAAAVFTGQGRGFAPCTAQACMALLRHYGIAPCGRHAVVIGRSPVVGRPVSMLLLRENATVTVCHTKTPDTAALTRQADIIITAAGAVNSLTAAHVRPGQTVLDVSMNWNGTALCGDADFPAVSSIVDAITPVPGGVGAVTSAVLMAHTVRAAEYLTGEGGA